MRSGWIVRDIFVGVPQLDEFAHCHDGIPTIYFDRTKFLDCANAVVGATVLLLDF